MGRSRHTMQHQQNDFAIMQMSIPVKMLIACCLSCITGIILMAATSYYFLMAVFIGILVISLIDVPLVLSKRMSIETASLIPMLILCFVYTPISWYTFDGLLGCTPFLSILFSTMIVLTYYKKRQAILLYLYAALLLGLTIHWFITWPWQRDSIHVVNILIAYIITLTVILAILDNVKRKNIEINQNITDLSLHDGLTELLNRRAVENVLQDKELDFSTVGTNYAVMMMDVDRFKDINDSFGHHIGDSVLKTLAQCIQRMIRTQDYAFRYGGDEFLLVLSNVDEMVTSQIRERIRSSLLNVQGFTFSITISVGCSLRSECTNAAEALMLADKRMYQDKEGSRERPSSGL